MIAWVLVAAVATLGVQVDAGTLVVAKDGRWTATENVRIHYKGYCIKPIRHHTYQRPVRLH